MLVFAALSVISVVFECFSYVVSILPYVVAAGTLAIGCYYLRLDAIWGKRTIESGILAIPHVSRVAADDRLRTVLFTVSGLIANIIFAAMNGVTGILNHSAWFGSLSAYYILLSFMRARVGMQERKIAGLVQKQECISRELSVYHRNSILFILLAIVLIGMVVLLEHSPGGKQYPGFMIYAAAAFTFYKIIISTMNVVKERKRRSPHLMILRKIGYIDACVSILTLQTAMFSAFGTTGEDELVKVMNGLTGACVSIIVLGMGVQGICSAKKYNRA